MTRLFSVTAALLAISCRGGDRADSAFDTAVAAPAYTAHGPRVLFDQGHHNHHTIGSTYRPLARLLESDGYRVGRLRGAVTWEALRDADVLVIPLAQGNNERNDDPAFQADEIAALAAWVDSGGALLLITDHYPFGHAVESLGAAFGVVMAKGAVEDTSRYDPAFEPTHIVYSTANGGLADHPITRGLTKVLTFTGQGLRGPAESGGFLRVSDAAVSRPAQPIVERDGGDVRVHVTYGDPVPARSFFQGLAITHGRGRVVVLGDAAMITAQLRRFDGRPVGMNVAGYDNRQLALNIMHWLTHRL